MLVALFGGAGFIGGHLVRALLAEGYRIRLALMGDEKWLDKRYLHPNLTLFAFDSESEESVARAVKGADKVVNLAGILTETKRRNFFTTHQQLPTFIARACRAEGVSQLIHISALGAAADAPSEYLRSKAAGEKAILAEFPDRATIIRPSIVLGANGAFVQLMRRMARLTPLLLLPCGLSRVQPIAVQDLSRLMVLLVKRKTAGKDKIINAAGSQPMSMQQLVSLILRSAGMRRMVLPMPYGMSYGLAALMEKLLRHPPITTDNCLSLSKDFLCSENHSRQLLGELTEISEALK